jgi:glycosyltransferase involved in cell wall biosynthesis
MKGLLAAAALARYPVRFPRLSRFDGMLVYRSAVPAGVPFFEASLASRSPVPFALDIDDPIFLHPPRSLNPAARRTGDKKWRRLCAASTVTICHNRAVADHMRPYCSRVTILPNVIDTTRYSPGTESDLGSRLAIGFNGSPTTMDELGTVAPALGLLHRDSAFDFHVMGGRSPFRDVPFRVVEHPWDGTREVELLRALDIGIAPARDNEWNRFKSFVKVLVYMAVGLPVVASRIGSNPELIRDGENGFLAGSTDEWVEKLRTLLDDAELRRTMGGAARVTIEREYSLEELRPEIIETFGELLSASR